MIRQNVPPKGTPYPMFYFHGERVGQRPGHVIFDPMFGMQYLTPEEVAQNYRDWDAYNRRHPTTSGAQRRQRAKRAADGARPHAKRAAKARRLPSCATAEPPIVPPSPPVGMMTALYRHFDEDGRLLYIGITDEFGNRISNHQAFSSWWDFVARHEIQWFGTRKEACRAEIAAIRSEQPLFNDHHNRSPEARARLVAYLVEKGRLDLLAPAVSRG